MIAPPHILVAAFGIALMSSLIYNSDGYNDPVTIDEILPTEYEFRKALVPVIQEFERMYDSVFLRKSYQRPYNENVLELLFSMRRFLDQKPKLKRWLKPHEVAEVLHYSDALREPDSLTRREIQDLLRQPRPDYNPRNRQFIGLSFSGNESPIEAYLSSRLR